MYSQKIHQYLECFLSLLKIILKQCIQVMSKLQWVFQSNINDQYVWSQYAFMQTHTLMAAALRLLATTHTGAMSCCYFQCQSVCCLQDSESFFRMQWACIHFTLNSAGSFSSSCVVPCVFNSFILLNLVCVNCHWGATQGWLIVESVGPNDFCCQFSCHSNFSTIIRQKLSWKPAKQKRCLKTSLLLVPT